MGGNHEADGNKSGSHQGKRLQQNDIEDLSCLEVINETIAGEDGIVHVSVDTGRELVTFEYESERISEEDIARVAQAISPVLHQRWDTCTMRLGKHGGRACESCALQLENRLQRLPGVRRATASYLGGVLSVTYDHALISPEDIAHQVEKFGVPVEPSASEVTAVPAPAPQPETWLPRIASRFSTQQVEIVFTALTLMGMMAGYFAERAGAALPTAVFYAVAYAAGGAFGLRAGFQSLRTYTIDIDLLMILAAIGAAVVGEPFEGAMLLFLFSLSNVLQEYALDRTRNAIKSLMKLRPQQALVRRDRGEIILPIERILIDDHIIVKPGERIALDGEVVAGESAVDQSSITGESLPIGKQPGDSVFAGTINKNGSLEIRVTRLASDSTIARLIKLVEEAHSEKAETQRFIDAAEQYYAMGVIALTAVAIIGPPLLFQEAFNIAFYRAMTIMVAASPCALVISTPATVLSAIGNGARRGVLFKGGVYVEAAANVKVVAFDKTGTLTIGEPKVTDVIPTRPEVTADELLRLAAAVEGRSEHPLAQAVVDAAGERALHVPTATNFQAATGTGVQAAVNGRVMHIGNRRYYASIHADGLAAAASEIERLQGEGKTSVIVAQMDEGTAHVLGVIAFADIVRPVAAEVVRELKANGIEHVVMLTGDNEQVARHIAAQVGVDDVYANLLPEHKVNTVKEIREMYGPVAMVGDGVNDAPAMATAAIGIAMGAAGTDVALETADIVLMSDDLKNIPYVMALSRKTRRTLAANLGFSMFMILLMITAIFTANLPLPLAVIGHEGGTVLVSLNGMRLLAFSNSEL
ncbi:MAG: heavy metal translocating P-type ATPase [Anaerolineae bacterium]